MADSISKMVTPSEIFGLAMSMSSRNSGSTMFGNFGNYNSFKSDKHPLHSHTLCSNASIIQPLGPAGDKFSPQTAPPTSAEMSSNDYNNIQDKYNVKPITEYMKSLPENNAKSTLNYSKSLPGKDQHCQEESDRERVEPLYYIIARTPSTTRDHGSNGTANVHHVTSDSSIPLMVINSSLPSTAVIPSSVGELNNGCPKQAALHQVLTMIPTLPQFASTPHPPLDAGHYQHLLQHQQQLQPQQPMALQGHAQLDPHWLKALASLLQLHVANGSGPVPNDPSDSRIFPDHQQEPDQKSQQYQYSQHRQQLQTISTPATTIETTACSAPISHVSSRVQGVSPDAKGSCGKSYSSLQGSKNNYQRKALSEIQPYRIPTQSAVDNDIKATEMQTHSRVSVLPQCASKRQLVFVSPLVSEEQDTNTKPSMVREKKSLEESQPPNPRNGEDLSNLTRVPPEKDSSSDNARNQMIKNDTADPFISDSSKGSDTDSGEISRCHEDNFAAQDEKPGEGFQQQCGTALLKRSDSAMTQEDMEEESVEAEKENGDDDDSNPVTETPSTRDEKQSRHLMVENELPKLEEVFKTPMFPVSPMPTESEARTVREKHNLKERKRRARIKDSCDLMRQIVPGMSQKTDKATVFEFSARYIHYLKSQLGSGKDKEFLLKYSPY